MVTSVGRLLVLAAFVAVPLASARAQRRDTRGGPDKRDTTPATRVVVIPAVERYPTSRLGAAIKDLEVIAVFTTDGAVARGLATKAHADVGGSAPLIQINRAGRGAEEFARALVDSIVEKTARPNMNRAIVLVAEPELIRPFLRTAVPNRGSNGLDENGGMTTFVVFVRADNIRLLMARP